MIGHRDNNGVPPPDPNLWPPGVTTLQPIILGRPHRVAAKPRHTAPCPHPHRAQELAKTSSNRLRSATHATKLTRPQRPRDTRPSSQHRRSPIILLALPFALLLTIGHPVIILRKPQYSAQIPPYRLRRRRKPGLRLDRLPECDERGGAYTAFFSRFLALGSTAVRRAALLLFRCAVGENAADRRDWARGPERRGGNLGVGVRGVGAREGCVGWRSGWGVLWFAGSSPVRSRWGPGAGWVVVGAARRCCCCGCVGRRGAHGRSRRARYALVVDVPKRSPL